VYPCFAFFFHLRRKLPSWRLRRPGLLLCFLSHPGLGCCRGVGPARIGRPILPFGGTPRVTPKGVADPLPSLVFGDRLPPRWRPFSVLHGSAFSEPHLLVMPPLPGGCFWGVVFSMHKGCVRHPLLAWKGLGTVLTTVRFSSFSFR